MIIMASLDCGLENHRVNPRHKLENNNNYYYYDSNNEM